MTSTSLSALALTALCFCSALGVVFTTYLTREAHADISSNRAVIDELDVQWRQLQIEESTFSQLGLIERAAQKKLGMVYPGLAGSVMIVRKP